VSDKVLAHKRITEEREQKAKDPDKTEYLKAIMYHPLTVQECFLSGSQNPFPIEAARQHLDYLRANQITGRYIRLHRDSSNVVRHKFAEPHDRPISEFPTKGNTGTDAPIIIWEEPIPNAPVGLYVGGADPYNQSVSQWSDSLGTFCIFKRMTDVIGETYQDMVVASFAARPESMDKWHETVEMLMEYYNAVCFPENEAATFIQYFERKNKGHMLAQGFNIAKEINPNTKATGGGRIYGLAATEKNIDYCMSLMIEYCKDLIQVGTNPNTKEPIMKMGVTRILDPILLEEIIKYSPEDGNYDRIVAFRHALAYAKHLDKYYPIIKIEEQPRERQEKPKRSSLLDSPFVKSPSSFGKMGTMFPKTNWVR
jgi:hypothetical protein